MEQGRQMEIRMDSATWQLPYWIGHVLRNVLRKKEVITNIRANKRRDNADDILVDDELYAERYYIERTDAWVDSFRTVLNRFDTYCFQPDILELSGFRYPAAKENFTKIRGLNHFYK